MADETPAEVNLVDFPKWNPKPLNPKRSDIIGPVDPRYNLSQFGSHSQGALFEMPKPAVEHQWAAHGYSPLRRAEVSAAFGVIEPEDWADPTTLRTNTGEPFKDPGVFVNPEKFGPKSGGQRP